MKIAINHTKIGFGKMINSRIILITICLLFVAVKGFSQQDPMYTQYVNNPITINPAYSGVRGVPNFTGVFRKQWLGFEGAPTTSSLSYNTLLANYNMGVGASLIYDAIGPTTQTGFYVNYAYHVMFDNNTNLSLGLNGGGNYFYIDNQKLTTDQPDDDINNLVNESVLLPNFGVGVFYYSKKMYLGLSVPKLIKNSLDKLEVRIDHLNREEWHWFFMGGYLFDISDDFDFKPSFMTRYVAGSPVSVDLAATFILYDKISLGAMYRINDSFDAMIKWQVNPKLEIGYSYDMTNSQFRSYNKGTHEIMVSYTFVKEGKRIMSPRFF